MARQRPRVIKPRPCYLLSNRYRIVRLINFFVYTHRCRVSHTVRTTTTTIAIGICLKLCPVADVLTFFVVVHDCDFRPAQEFDEVSESPAQVFAHREYVHDEMPADGVRATIGHRQQQRHADRLAHGLHVTGQVPVRWAEYYVHAALQQTAHCN